MNKLISILKLSLIAVVLLIAPSTVFGATYTLSNGDSFEGSENEYKYAEIVLEIQDEYPEILDKVWEKIYEKNKKSFPTTEQILKTATFSGNASYNPITKEYTITKDSKTGGKIVFEVKHKFSKSKLKKLTKEFTAGLVKEVDMLEKEKSKEAGIFGKKLTVKPGSDLEYIMDGFDEFNYDVGFAFGSSMQKTVVDLDIKTNQTNNLKLASYSTLGKKYEFNQQDKEESDLYIDVSNNYSDTLEYGFFDEPLTKTHYIYLELDEKAPVGSGVRISISDIRQFVTLLSDDIWFDFN